MSDGSIGISHLATAGNLHAVVAGTGTTDQEIADAISPQQRTRSPHEDRVATATGIRHVDIGNDRLPAVGNHEGVS